MIHTLKIQSEYFEAVRSGKKRFEVRKDDRTPRYEVGDTLLLEEITADGTYTGRDVSVLVDYVYRGPIGLQDEYCIMSIRLKNTQEETT